MPRTIETKIYTFDELSDSAKEKARDWYRQYVFTESHDWEYVFDDAATIADLFGLDICQTRKTRGDNSHYYAPTIYFSGFSCQGDGACFEGHYKYKKGALKAVKQYAPLDETLHQIVKELQEIQSKNFYKLIASTKHSGRYYHSGHMDVSVQHVDDNYRDIGMDEVHVRDALRSFADWIYKQLEKEHDYQNSDECIDENILANEYEFDENGKRI